MIEVFRVLFQVDNHVDASSCMNRHLLRNCIGRFVSEASRSGTDEKVFTLNGRPMTLIQVGVIIQTGLEYHDYSFVYLANLVCLCIVTVV